MRSFSPTGGMRCRTRSPANCPDPGVSRRFRCPGMLPQCYPAPTGLFFQVPETAVFQRFRTSRKQRPRVTLGLFWPAKRGDDPDSNKRAMRRDGVRECPKTRAVEDIRTSSIRRSRRRIPLPFYSLCVRIHLYALCMQSVCIPNCIHFRPLSPTNTPILVSVCIVCSLFRSCVLA